MEGKGEEMPKLSHLHVVGGGSAPAPVEINAVDIKAMRERAISEGLMHPSKTALDCMYQMAVEETLLRMEEQLTRMHGQTLESALQQVRRSMGVSD